MDIINNNKKNNVKENLIIDTDTGIDDSIALMMGFCNDDLFNIQLMSVVAGNMKLHTAKRDALHLCELFNKPFLPVVAGAAKPLFKPLVKASVVGIHGKFGIGNYKFPKLKIKALKANLQKYTIELLKKNGLNNTSLLCLDPLTNIAKLFTKYPESKDYIKQIVFMGGSLEKVVFDNKIEDYIIPYAEFNVNFDPEAAKIVLESGVKLVMVPMELGHTAFLNPTDIEVTSKLNNIGSILASFYKYYFDRHVPNGNAATHDACAMAYLIDESIFEKKPARITMCANKQNLATINCDFSNDSKPNATVCTKIDIEKFKQMYFDCLKTYK